MATIKSYTDLEQSKKLAEILPLESADYFHAPDAGVVVTEPYKLSEGDETVITAYKGAIPCWSLAALLGVLPRIEGLKPVLDLDINYIQYHSDIDLCATADNPVDACVAMIEKLHELNLL
jgi:hypothetical protein